MIGVVGVECLARDDAPAVHELVVGDVRHVGMAGNVVLLLVVRLQLAEQLHGVLEVFRREMLVAHDQHVMLGEGAIERGAGFGIDRLGEIDAGDFGAGVIRQRRDGEGRHGKSSHAVFVRRTLSPGTWRVKRRPGPAPRISVVADPAQRR